MTRAQYSHSVTAVLLQLRTDFRTAGKVRAASMALRSMKTSLDRAALRLALVRPTAQAATLHRSLVGEVRDYARQVDLVRASVDYGDVGAIASHLREITAPRAINRTLDRLSAKGYEIPVRVAGVR